VLQRLKKFLKPFKERTGSSTVEFVLVIPFFLLMALFVWQFAVAGLAVLDTQAALRDAVRVAAVEKDPGAAIQQAKASFGKSGAYRASFNVSIGSEQAVVTARTEVDIVFASGLPPITFTRSAVAPVLD
jgi:Flp pilus assembly protein TadG